MTVKTQHTKCQYSQASATEEIYNLYTHSVDLLLFPFCTNFLVEKLGKEEHWEPEICQRRKKIKVRAEISKTETDDGLEDQKGTCGKDLRN